MITGGVQMVCDMLTHLPVVYIACTGNSQTDDLRFVRPLPRLNPSTEPLVGDPRYLKATVSSFSGVNRDQNRNQEESSWEGITEGVERSGETAQIRSQALALKRLSKLRVATFRSSVQHFVTPTCEGKQSLSLC